VFTVNFKILLQTDVHKLTWHFNSLCEDYRISLF